MTKPRRRVHITPAVFARWIGVHEETVKRWIRAKKLPALNVGGVGVGAPRYRIFRKDAAAFLASRGLSPEHIHERFA
jgi:hypothetical protein